MWTGRTLTIFKRAIQNIEHSVKMSTTIDPNRHKSTNTDDPRIKYCAEHSIRFHPAQLKLQAATLGLGTIGDMIGAPEVLQMCSNLIQLIGGKRILDIGELIIFVRWNYSNPNYQRIFTMRRGLLKY